MTLSGIYEKTEIKDYIKSLEGEDHPNTTFFYKYGELVTDGFIEDGMVVEIHCKDGTIFKYNVLGLLPVPFNTLLSVDELSSSTLSKMTYSNSWEFILPIDGMDINCNISSPFGERYDPYYKKWKLHAGIDIAYPKGTLVRAVRDGTIM